MKNIFLSAFMFAFFIANATDRYVDPTLSAGDGVTLFTTIASAVATSVNGDRIIIAPGSYAEPTLTLNKSLTLISQTAGSTVYYNGNIVIAGFAGMKLQILGFNLGVYSVSSSAIATGSSSNRAKVSIIDSKMVNMSLDQDYYELNCARCSMSGTTTFRFGNFVVSKTNDLYVLDEPQINQVGSKHLIAGDTVISRLEVRNDDFPVTIANCQLYRLQFWKWNNNIVNTNYIRNNDFLNNAELFFADNSPGYNFEFTSNLFLGLVSFYSGKVTFGSCSDIGTYNGQQCINGCYPSLSGNTYCAQFSAAASLFPNPAKSGFFKWTYNGIDLPCTVPSGSDPLVLTKIIGTTGTTVNSGNPNHDFYDIDLTINDRGRNGGTYCIQNYNPTYNPSNGKAYIFDLEIPSDLFPSVPVNIKAKGYHRN